MLDIATDTVGPAIGVTQGRPAFLATKHVVSSSHYLATMAGLRMFALGGNAADAGVAAGIALNVLERHLTDFGGVAPVMFFRPGMTRPETLAGVGCWPRRLTLRRYLERYETDMPIGAPRYVTPAAPDAWLTALARYGRLTLGEVLRPACELCEGFPVFDRLARTIASLAPRLREWPASARVFLPNGRPPQTGDVLVQRDLGALFARLIEIEHGAKPSGREAAIMAARDDVYRGAIARAIVAHAERTGSELDAEDLAAYHVAVEPSVSSTYRDVEVHACGPWSQGPLLPMVLNLLQGANMRELGRGSGPYLHYVIESIKIACADREGFFGDPNHVDVPIAGLLNPEYADERRRLIDSTSACPRLPLPGDPWRYEGRSGPAGYVPAPVAGSPQPDTSFVCAMDAEGHAFCATPSDPGLSAPLVDDLGMIISTRGAQLWATPGHPSAIAPGKRPRLTPNPAMLMRSGRAVMPVGCPGGDAQVQAMVQVISNVLDFEMNAQAAIEAPRVISASFPSSFHPHGYEPGVVRVEGRIPPSVREHLAVRGHTVHVLPDFTPVAAAVCAIRRRDGGVLEGGADPRRESYAAGW
ncbi:MAG TPA: gamma-glutamyltransferase [bacterium]|nr:gamma-glutamyltransferase [bacterium]